MESECGKKRYFMHFPQHGAIFVPKSRKSSIYRWHTVLTASLEEFVENLASDGLNGLKPFRLLQKEYQDPAQTHLMKLKGVYPYNYVNFFF